MRRLTRACFVVAMMAPVATARAAAGAAPAAAASTPTPSSPKPAPAPAEGADAADGYNYQIDGRRDPFLSLVASGPETPLVVKRGEGIQSLAVNELSVRGILKSRGAFIAMVQGPDKRAYVVHQGDKFLDGSIKAVTHEGLVIVQQVNDPLSLVKQREVRKLMRSVEDGKQ